MSKFTEEFAMILEEYQEKTGQTYREIAEQIGVDHSTISEIKSGKIHRPTPKLLAKLDKVFNLPESYLLVAWARQYIPDLTWYQILKEHISEKSHTLHLPFTTNMQNSYFALTCEDVIEMKPSKPFYLEAGCHDTVGGDIHKGDLLKVMPKAKIKLGNFVLWIHRNGRLSIRKYRQFGNRIHLIPLNETIPTVIAGLQRVKRMKLLKVVELRRKARID